MVEGQQEVTLGTKGTVWDIQQITHDSMMALTSIQSLGDHLLRSVFQSEVSLLKQDEALNKKRKSEELLRRGSHSLTSRR